jgi:maltooligosyltrehalose trehalohydrolase
MSASLPAQPSFGAQVLGNGRTRFRLWAPALDDVTLELGDGRREHLRPDAQGWFCCELECGAGTAYRYRLADGTAVPDPASRAQADDVHGDSLVVDPDAYAWRNITWRGRPWTETVLYEVHVGLCGGFSGLQQQLPALAELGVTAIELMPVADFPGTRNWGYDGVLPFAPDRAYGSPEDLKSLVDAAHDLGLMMFLDVVYNHFGPDGNYLHAYAPAFFREDRQTPWGPAIDFRRPEVRAFFTSNARYWLEEYRFDGLRFDAVHAIREPEWLLETAATIRAALEPARHVHLVLENDDNDAALLEGAGTHKVYDAQWNDDGHHALHVLLTGENQGYYAAYAQEPAQQLARCLSEGFIFQGENWPLNGEPRGTPSAQLPPSAFVLFLQNHDQIGNRALGERLTRLADPQALRAATALQLLCPMIPLLFMGEPWGAQEPFLFFTDHGDELAEQVREGRRREFAQFPAFADEAQRARIPDPNAQQTFDDSRPRAADTEARARSLADEVRKLLRTRRESIVPGLPGCRSLGADTLGAAGVCARWKLGNGRELLLAMNLATEPVPFTPPAGGTRIYASRADIEWRDERLAQRSTVAYLL